MARTVVIDELFLTVRVPEDMPDAEAEVVRQTLLDEAFMRALRRAIRVVVRAFPELASVRVSVTR